MPTPIAKGIIIAVSVLAAAGLAAYENPQVRAWIDQSRHKIAMALYSLGDDIHPRSRSPRPSDASMREDMSEAAEERRRKARAEILERGRIMEERQRKRTASGNKSKTGSFDTLVDQDGTLKKDVGSRVQTTDACTTAIELQAGSQDVTERHYGNTVKALRQSVDSHMALRQLGPEAQSPEDDADIFANSYEREMRNTWNMPLPPMPDIGLSSHASESLIDFTPTSEVVPDPDVSVPDSTHLTHPLDRSQNFSAPGSTSSHTISDDEHEFYYAHPQNPLRALPAQALRPSEIEVPSVSSAPSVAGSIDHMRGSEFDDSDDGVLSEFGGGIRTPSSAWTEVDSVVGSDGDH